MCVQHVMIYHQYKYALQGVLIRHYADPLTSLELLNYCIKTPNNHHLNEIIMMEHVGKALLALLHHLAYYAVLCPFGQRVCSQSKKINVTTILTYMTLCNKNQKLSNTQY